MTDLGRTTSNILVDVRTVLSRAETALEHWPAEPRLVTKHADWVNGVFIEPETIPHPEADEMKAALEEVIRLLAPWRRTGRPSKP